jgi:hypothetical protein
MNGNGVFEGSCGSQVCSLELAIQFDVGDPPASVHRYPQPEVTGNVLLFPITPDPGAPQQSLQGTHDSDSDKRRGWRLRPIESRFVDSQCHSCAGELSRGQAGHLDEPVA